MAPSSSSSSSATDEGPSGQDTDHLLARLGNPGRFQILLFFLLSTQYFPVAMNDLMPLFYSVLPTEVRCRDWDADVVGLAGNVSDGNFSAEAGMMNQSAIRTNHSALCSTPCKSGYVYYYPDRQWSIVADMNLICERGALINVASTIYFMGSLLGGLFWGEMADRYGRRKTLLITNLLYTFFSGGTIFSRDYTSFVILRFCTGFAVQSFQTFRKVMATQKFNIYQALRNGELPIEKCPRVARVFGRRLRRNGITTLHQLHMTYYFVCNNNWDVFVGWMIENCQTQHNPHLHHHHEHTADAVQQFVNSPTFQLILFYLSMSDIFASLNL
ncbi:hypothetical protein BV898_17132 [Hypsibius exemplaris]|uniref:Major facilitator superfamily (MFS) profile domain-containing protein n=1 Tax=Hypsibius exemplaris TaxID=2072580 RepID=A0A9X6RMI8_HYPEX|nr:hypothetical protein BV898_17132 [Hypsibius exemplaris]